MEASRGSGGSGRRPIDLLVAGHTNLDHFWSVPELPVPDRTVPVERRSTRLGGTAANIARTAAGFGVATGLLSRVGEDFPRPFRDELARARVDLRGFETVRGELSPCCYIVEDGRGRQMTFIDQGPMGHGRGFRVPRSLLREASWVHVTTGHPPSQTRLAEAARKLGTRVALDPAQEIHYRWERRSLERILKTSEILFGNEGEVRRAAQLLGLRSPTALLERVPLVVMTRGPRGATAYTRRGRVSVPAARPHGKRHLVGAGDAFRGGFYAAWFAGQPTVRCLRAGSRAAATWIETGTATAHRGRSASKRTP